MKNLLRKMNYLNLDNKLKDCLHLIKNSKGIIVAGHINPDGDDIASQLALGEYLLSIKKKFIIAWSEDIPKSYQFLPNLKLITNITETQVTSDEYDLVIIVDCGDIERIGDIRKFIKKQKIINIDHHEGNTNFGDLNIVLENACSIGELLYYFFKKNNIEISYNIAVDLYISIITDTGSFRYDCMHPEVHLITADLLKKGVVPSDFNIYLNQNKSLSYVKLLALVLSRLEMHQDNKIVISSLFYNDFRDVEDVDTDGIIEYLGMIESVSVYIFIKEKKPDLFSASLRSKYNVDVAKIALYFNGGGHMRAAGCKTDKMDYEKFKDTLIQKVLEQL